MGVTDYRELHYSIWRLPHFSKLGSIWYFSMSHGPFLNEVRHSTGSLFWLEGRPNEGGRYVVCRYSPEAQGVSVRGAIDVTPSDHNVRTRVHEYGGGSFLITSDPTDGGREVIIYSNFKDQRLYKVIYKHQPKFNPNSIIMYISLSQVPTDGGVSICLTPLSETFPSDALYRFADGVLDAQRGRLICVREDHSKPEPANVRNAIVAVALDGTGDMQVYM